MDIIENLKIYDNKIYKPKTQDQQCVIVFEEIDEITGEIIKYPANGLYFWSGGFYWYNCNGEYDDFYLDGDVDYFIPLLNFGDDIVVESGVK